MNLDSEPCYKVYRPVHNPDTQWDTAKQAVNQGLAWSTTIGTQITKAKGMLW